MANPISETGDANGDPLIGKVLANRYQIEAWLGEGAMGSVYKAKHVKVGRAFAVKVLHKRLLEDRKVMQRFEREAELAGRLHHPNVIGVVDIGEAPDGSRYMVMDFAHGADLATLLAEAPMPAARIIHLTRQLLEGLYHAHEQGLIHRDFKPENVIIERDDHGNEVPRIVDFGIAILRDGGDSVDSLGRLTTNGLVLGTPHYMAPEQAIADPLDHRVDLFALGIVVYELLCGKLPFDGSGVEVARANLLLDPPAIAQRVPFLEVDPLLEAFARRLMAKKRDARPATAKAARELLDRIANDRSGAAVELGLPPITSSREPALTLPVTQAIVLEAPPLQSPIAAVPVTAPRAPDVVTIDVGEPLGWGDRPARRRTWLVPAIAGAAVVIVVAIVVGVGRASDPPPQSATTSQTKAPPQPPAHHPPVAPPADHEPIATPPETAATIDAPAKPHRTPAQPIHVVKSRVAVAITNPAPASISPVAPTIEPAKPEIAPVSPGELVAAPGIDAKALQALYIAVGQDFKAAAQARGAAAVTDLEATFRRIQIQDAISDPQKREAVAATLHRLRAQLAPLKQPP